MRIQNKRNRKFNKLQRREQRAAMLKKALSGKGLFVYRNRTSGDLSLPKPTTSGQRVILKGAEWEGDDYYMAMVPQEAILVRIIQTPQEQKEAEEKMIMEEKLILDQPETVTQEGQVEQVVAEPEEEVLTETPEDSPTIDVLINENPMDGIEIIRD